MTEGILNASLIAFAGVVTGATVHSVNTVAHNSIALGIVAMPGLIAASTSTSGSVDVSSRQNANSSYKAAAIA